MNRQHNVPAGFFFHEMQKRAELLLASPRLYVPRRFGFPNYDQVLGGRIQVWAIPMNLRWKAVGRC